MHFMKFDEQFDDFGVSTSGSNLTSGTLDRNGAQVRRLGWTQGHEDLLFACLDDDMGGTLTAEDMKSIFDIIQSKSRQKRAAQAKASWRQLRRHRMKTEEKQTLMDFRKEPHALDASQAILAGSQNPQAQFHAIATLQAVGLQRWTGLSHEARKHLLLICWEKVLNTPPGGLEQPPWRGA